MKYDYLIIGSGLFGSVFAYRARQKRKTCLIIEKRSHIGGNVYTKYIEGINVHCYGAHIFHTNDKEVWDFVNQFAEFNRYTNSPIANYLDKIYNLPFNMNTFYQMWGIYDPTEAERIIESQRLKNIIPRNLEEQALSLVGKEIYEKLIKGYTEKQWGRSCKNLPPFIIKRLPLRFTFDNNYFNDKFQGIPIGGYTQIVEKMLNGCDILLNTDYHKDRNYLDMQANKIVYTGMIDEYFDYVFKKLDYRSLLFETETLNVSNFQGNAVVNYTDYKTPYTRIIEHKHFEFGTQPKTVITREIPINYNSNTEPYYPINDERNNTIYYKYLKLADRKQNVIFGGRLADYKYYDMWQVIRNALNVKI